MSNDPNGTKIPESLMQSADPDCTKAAVPNFFGSGPFEPHPKPFAWVLDMRDFVKVEGAQIDSVVNRFRSLFGTPEPRRHSMPPAGASACSTSAPEIQDELAGRGLIDHSGRARKPIHFGPVHGKPPRSKNYRCATTPITPEDEREILRKADQDRRFARIDWRDPEIARAEAVRLEGECDRFFDRVSDLEMTLNKRKAELRDIHNALAQFGPGHSDTKPDTETLTDCVKKLVAQRLGLEVEKALAVDTLDRVSEITECPVGADLVRHVTAGMKRYRDAMQAKEIVRLATARVGSEPGFLLTGIDIMKEKIQRLQERIDRGLARGFIF